MVCVWDEITKSEPRWKYKNEVDKVYAYTDTHCLIQFHIALLDIFEATRTSVLNRKLLLSLDTTLKDLITLKGPII